MFTYNIIQYKCCCVDNKILFLLDTPLWMWKSTPSRPGLKTTLQWVYTPTPGERGSGTYRLVQCVAKPKEKNPIAPVGNRSPGQACNQSLHWATPGTRTSMRCLKIPRNRNVGRCRIQIRESHRLKSNEHQILATYKFEPAIFNESSDIIWRQSSGGNSCGGNPVKSEFKISVATSQRIHTAISTKTDDTILGKNRRLFWLI